MDFTIKKPTHIFALLILLLTLFILSISPIFSFIGILPSTQDITLTEPILLLSSIITIVILIGAPFLWYLLVNKLSIKEIVASLNLRKQNIDMAVLWAVLSVIVTFAIIFVSGIILTWLGILEEDISNVQVLADNLSLGSLVFIILVQSTGEELFFRGFLLGKINYVAGKEIAICSTAILFGLAHLSYGTIYPGILTALFGVLLGYMVIKTKNLYSAIFAHILYNSISITLYLLAQSLHL